ncbi:MAG: ABC transporter ATP-binding protein, partial [Dehalococcoidia bacterium]
SSHVRVVSPQAAELAPLLTAEGASVREGAENELLVTGMEAAKISDIAAANNVRVHELSSQRASLEAAFMELTKNSVDFHAGGASAPDQAEVAETVRALTEERNN